MKVFTCTTFSGFYPVGTAAVIVAPNSKEAKEQLEAALAAKGLPQKIKLNDLKEIETFSVGTYILCDGNY